MADTLHDDRRSGAKRDTEKWLESWSHKCVSGRLVHGCRQKQSPCCDCPQKVVTMEPFWLHPRRCFSVVQTALMSCTSVHNCTMLPCRGGVSRMEFVDTDAVAQARPCWCCLVFTPHQALTVRKHTFHCILFITAHFRSVSVQVAFGTISEIIVAIMIDGRYWRAWH